MLSNTQNKRDLIAYINNINILNDKNILHLYKPNVILINPKTLFLKIKRNSNLLERSSFKHTIVYIFQN